MSERQLHGCPDANMLAEYIDGGLDPRQRADIEAHLAECETCYAVFEDAVSDAAGRSPAAAGTAPSADRRRPWQMAAAAVVLVAVGGAAWFAFSAPDRRLRQLASTGETRLALARLAPPFEWAPPPEATRGSGTLVPAPRRRAADDLETHFADDASLTAERARGLSSLALRDLDSAVRHFERAVELDPDRADTYVELSAVLIERWRTAGAALDATSALDASRRALELRPRDAAALFNRALAWEALGSRDDAIAAWNEVLAAESRAEWLAEAREHLSRLMARGGGRPAARRYQRGEDIIFSARVDQDRTPLSALATDLPPATADAELPAWLRALTAGAGAETCLAQARQALARWNADFQAATVGQGTTWAEAGRRALVCAGLPTITADVRLAISQFDEGRRPEAEALSLRVAANAARLGYSRAAARAWQIAALTAANQDRLADEAARLTQAMSFARQADDDDLQSMTAGMLAESANRAGAVDRAWEHLHQALQRLTPESPVRVHYRVLGDAATVAESMGLAGAALEFSASLERRTADWSNPGGVLTAFIIATKSASAIGSPTQAAAWVRRAESMTAGLPAGRLQAEFGAYLALARGQATCSADRSDAMTSLRDAANYFQRGGNLVQALRGYLELGTCASALGHADIADASWNAGAQLVEAQRSQLRDPMLRISRLDRVWTLFGQLVRARFSRSPAQALATADAVRARELRASLPATGAATDVLDFQTWLPARYRLAYFMVLPSETLVWTTDGSAVTGRRLDVSERALRELVTDARMDVRSGRPPSPRLGQLLLTPIGLRPSERLLVIPDGALNALSFASLINPVTGRFVIEDHDVVVAPSLASARALGRRSRVASTPATPVAISGEGPIARLSLAALPGAMPEAESVVRTLGRGRHLQAGAGMTREALDQLLQQADVIHIAAHAVVNALNPLQSSIVLSSDATFDLTSEAIARLRLDHAGVVFLSACDSGVGPVARGEGALSIARAFLAAGAGSAVAALWPAGDASHLEVITDFYRHLATTHDPSAALAASQRDAILRKRSPAAWATFEVIAGPTRSTDG